MDFKLFIKVGIAKKTQERYIALGVDLGYRQALLTFDKNLISEMLDMSISELYELVDKMKVNEIRYLEPVDTEA